MSRETWRARWGPAAIIGVYRLANAGLVERMIAPALASGWTTAWWALDEIHPALSTCTVGSGSGPRLLLLNRTAARAVESVRPVVLLDDDVVFRRGNVVTLARYCERAGFGLAQPAHTKESHVSHGITRAKRFSVARLTTFVECGPVVVISPGWLEHVLPLPEARGMGWGLELDWMDLRAEGCATGIVDASRIEHVGVVAGAYDKKEAVRRMRDELHSRGIDDWNDVQRTISVWRPWRRTPPWIAGG